MKQSPDHHQGKLLESAVMHSSASNVVDTTPPVLVSSNLDAPAPTANLVFTFSEPVKLGSGTLTLTGNGEIRKFDVGGDARLTVDGNTVTFDPPADLLAKAVYWIEFTRDAILDLSGNPVAWSSPALGFTTGLHQAPANVTGTERADRLHGGDFADTLSGAGGNDTLTGYGGDDILHGNAGQDTLNGDDGNDKLYGDADRDFLFGGAGDDLLDGGDGADYLNGGDGNDLLAGGAGNDTLVGDTGIDRALYTGTRSDYTLTRNENGFTVTDQRVTGGDGVDTLVGVERISFADGYLALDIDGIAGQAFRIYRAAFDRTPDLAGMGFWLQAMDQGRPLVEIAAGFAASKEFADVYGSAPGNADIVTRFYTNILHREPEPAGHAYWLDILDSAKASLPEVLAAISESAENRLGVAELIADGIPYAPYG